jgi:hypothetical protein
VNSLSMFVVQGVSISMENPLRLAIGAQIERFRRV